MGQVSLFFIRLFNKTGLREFFKKTFKTKREKHEELLLKQIEDDKVLKISQKGNKNNKGNKKNGKRKRNN